MAGTRAKSGYTAAKPQIYTPPVETSAKRTPRAETTAKKVSGSGAVKHKANTSEPRAKATTAGRIEKKKATPKKKKAIIGDKIEGAVKRATGKVEGKPGKKVGSIFVGSGWKEIGLNAEYYRSPGGRFEENEG